MHFDPAIKPLEIYPKDKKSQKYIQRCMEDSHCRDTDYSGGKKIN